MIWLDRCGVGNTREVLYGYVMYKRIAKRLTHQMTRRHARPLPRQPVKRDQQLGRFQCRGGVCVCISVCVRIWAWVCSIAPVLRIDKPPFCAHTGHLARPGPLCSRRLSRRTSSGCAARPCPWSRPCLPAGARGAVVVHSASTRGGKRTAPELRPHTRDSPKP